MKRLFPACGLFGALLACGCGSSKPEVPSWFKGDGGKGNPGAKNSPEQLQRDLTTKLKALEKKLAALDKVIADLEKSKTDIKARLAARGVRDSKDLQKPGIKDDEQIQHMAAALLKKSKECASYRRKHEEYGLALFDGNQARESLDHLIELRKAGIDEKEPGEELALTIHKIERMDKRVDEAEKAAEVKADDLLEKELKGN
jgi:hypothetical protein